MTKKRKNDAGGLSPTTSSSFLHNRNHFIPFLLTLLYFICTPVHAYETFPSTLDTPGYSNDFHLHGHYSFNASSGGIQVPVTFKSKTYCRFSMSNLTGYDATVRLTPTTGSSSTGLTADKHNHFSGVVSDGRYVLSILFTRQVVAYTQIQVSTSSTVNAYVEFAAAPYDDQKKRSDTFATAQCPLTSTDVYPTIDFSPLREHRSIHFSTDESSQQYYIFPTLTETYAHSWAFEIPPHDNSNNNGITNEIIKNDESYSSNKVATISATLYADFLTSGFLQIVLQANASDLSNPTNPGDIIRCVRNGGCVAGSRDHPGELRLRSALAPGKYALWVYWAQTAYTTDATPRCVPFGLAVDIEDAPFTEDLLSCSNSAPLAGDLDPFFNGAGELYYAQRVLIAGAHYTRTANFTVAVDSLIRVYVHDHPLDLDVDIADVQKRETVAYGMRSSGPEVIVARLPPGKYSVRITSFSLARSRLCDAFDVEIAVQPAGIAGATELGAFKDFCASKKVTVSPALEELTALGSSATAEAHVGEKEYVFMYDNSYSHRVITKKDFTSYGTARRLRARLGSNFVLNDITLQLTNKQTREVHYPAHDTRNAHTLDVLLEAGVEYTLSIHTGITQSSRVPGSEFHPACAPYTFALDVVVAGSEDAEAAKCAAHRELPSSLNTPEFLGTAHSVHVMETFRMPNVTASAIAPARTVAFSLERASYVRVFVPKHHVDIDVYLLNGTETLRAAMSFLTDESVAVVLPPGDAYALRFEFIHYSHPGEEPPCYLFPVELAITPWNTTSPASPQRCASTVDNLPKTSGFVPTTVEKGDITETWVSEGAYWAQRAGAAKTLNITFTLAKPSAFRAILHSEFVYGQLTLKLVAASATTVATLGYNGAEIPAALLQPGTYSLIGYEPYTLSGLPSEVLSACVRFSLTVAIGPATSIASSSAGHELVGALCEYSGVPTTLNHPGALSTLNGYRARVAGTYLVNTEKQRDYITLHVDEAMLYRVYVPETRYVDVDIYLRKGTPSQPGESIDHCAGLEEEMLFGEIGKGDYHLQLEYLNLGAGLTAAEACMGFPVVIAFEPVSAYKEDAKYSEACSAVTYPARAATLDTPVSATYKWSPTALESYEAEVTFTIDSDTARFDAELQYEFVPSGLSFRLSGSVRSGLLEIDADIDAEPGSGGNRLTLGSYLARGNYTLTIEDLASARTQSVKCAEYQLMYHINTKVRASPEACMEVEKLPTDLYTERGGSREYGGPQRPDGTVLVVGDHFFASTRAEYMTQWTRVNISEPSFVRVFTRTQAPNDVDVFLYRNRSQAYSLVDGSVSLGEYESALWSLPDTTPTTYDIKTHFFAVDYDTPCNYFRWAAAVRPSRVVATDILCPAILPAEIDRVPPETVQILGGAQTRIASDNYVFTSVFVETHSGASTEAGSNSFRYSILLDVKAPAATVTANLRYNFVTNDYKVRIRDYTSGEILTSGAAESIPSAMHYSRYNFRTVLRTRLTSGKYYLTIEETGLSGKTALTSLATRYCHYFGFELVATPEGGGSGGSNITADSPIIESVTPALLTHFEPCEDLYIQIAFSEAVASIPRGLHESTAYINTHKTMYLMDVNGTSDTPAFPVDLAVFEEDGKTLTLRFSNDNFNHTGAGYAARTFKLRINLGQLQDARGRTFEDPAIVDYVYSMASCDCTGDHGVCRVVSLADVCLQCVCAGHWAGARCEACEAGYHRAGDTCVKDDACTADTCNGHGACDDSSGKVRCVCDEGYASSEAAGLCGECAFGYAGYPLCVANTSDESDGMCNVAYLPRTLNAVAHLGWTGETDLSGEYYIDTAAKVHNTYFNLDRDTIVRVYAEPNKVDIDLWLYELKSDGVTIDHVIDYTMTFNGAEVLYKVLPGGTAANPRRYLLQFRYYVWNAAVLSPCETFELELGLHPSAAAVPRLAELAAYCANENTFPAPAAPAPITDDYAYAPAQNFTLHAPAYYRQEADYFWYYDFVVEGRAGHSVLLRTDVGSRFVSGQVMMVLESIPGKSGGIVNGKANFSATANHCEGETSSLQAAALAASAGSASRCVTGDSTMNGNYIERVVSPGSYRLWLYQPVPQNASVAECALYDFSFRVEYVDSTGSLWECTAGTQLPGTLNIPGYLTSSATGGDDTAHIQDTFYVAGNASFTFSIGKPCHFRVAGNDGALFAVARIEPGAVGPSDANASYAENVLASLEAGDYVVFVIPPYSSGGGEDDSGGCIYVDMELALEPLSAVALEPCPGPGVPVTVVMPDINSDENGLAAPFYFGPRANANLTDPTFVAQPYYQGGEHTTRVAQYTIVATETSVLFAAVSSSFLYHSLGLALYRNEGGSFVRVASSRLLYNYQYVKHTLVAGHYLLTLDIPTLEGRPGTLPTCLPFNLEIYHYNYGADSRCLLAGEPAPATFNNFRFLRPDGAFDFADTDFRVPLNITLRKSTYISFDAQRASVVRVYVEPNSAVDIDLRLFDSANRVIATSEGYIYTEETLTAVVEPGAYTLEIMFWVWDEALTAATTCPTFRMQASMKPVPANAAGAGSDKWPADIKETLGGSESDTSYVYSYEQAHYYVQRAEKAARHVMTFTLSRPCNVFAQTKYRFADGQLALKLNRMSGSGASAVAETYTGSVGPNRYTLSAKGMPAGSYQLVLYEPGIVPAEAIVGGKQEQRRIDFGFAFAVSRQAALFTNDHTSLPATLDSISYLAYDRAVHVFDPFVMFRMGGTQERTTFTVYEPSTVHAYAVFEGDTAAALQGPIRIGLSNMRAKGSKAIIAIADTEVHAYVKPGNYALDFVRQTSSSSATTSPEDTVFGEGQTVNVELSVQPISRLRNITEEIPYEVECTDNLLPSITPDALGRYSFSSDSRTISHETYTYAAAGGGAYVVDHKAIEVKTRSTLFAQLGYEFSLAHLTLMVELQQGGTVNGTAYRNLNTIRTVLPPGTHHLVILRPAAAPPAIKDLEHCTPFSVAIALAPVALGSSDACAYLDVVPWDLNRYDGGSALYGGPLDSTGSLLLYSDRFGVPSGTASSSLQLELYKDSLVSVLLAAGDGLSAVHAHLYGAVSGEVIDALGTAQTYGDRQQIVTFRVDPSKRRESKYTIVIHYTHATSSATKASTCSSFTMQVVVRPAQLVRDSLVCKAGFVPHPPDARIEVDEHGFASDYHGSAFLSTDPIHTKKGVYTIDFAVGSFSKFYAALTFDPLASLYAIQLYRDYRTPTSYQMSYGTYRAQQYDLGDSEATVTQVITDSLVAGNYTLVISQRDWTAPADLFDSKNTFCFPFVYSAHIIPLTGGYPYISDIEPYTAKHLSPAAPLTIAAIFSAPLYSHTNPAATPATDADILASFHLVTSDDSSSNAKVAPEEAAVDPSSNSSRWSITFPAGTLASEQTYRLAYTPGKVLDAKNRSVTYVFTNIFQTFDATCSGNGKLVNNACLCDEGYGGATCQLCDVGYVDVGKAGGPLRCIPSMSCDEGTCGCEYTNGTHCNPLGYCSLTDLGKATCDCNKGYTGAYCRKCAKGYSGWPRCVPCYNGASYVNGKCVCVGHFAGSKCQRCSFGYTGSDCNTLGGVIAVVTLSVIGALAVGIITLLVRKKIIEDPRRSYKRIINKATTKIKNVAGNNNIFYFDDDNGAHLDDIDEDGDDDDDVEYEADKGEPTNSIFTPIESSFGDINFEGNGIDDDEPSDFVLPSYNSNNGDAADGGSNSGGDVKSDNVTDPIDDFFSVKN